MSDKEQLYFNFPVKMMQGVLLGNESKRNNFLSEVLYYHIQNHAYTLEDLNEYEETQAQLFKRSAEFWNVDLNGGEESKVQKAIDLHTTYSNAKVFVGLNKEIFWDFYKNEKTQFDWECLFAYLALKSIIGKKRYCKTDNALMFARMAGKEVKKDFEKMKGFGFTEYHRNKIITKLETDWHLKYYSRYTRGFYFGIDISLQELIFEAEARRETLKRQSLKNEKAEILKKWQNSRR